MALELEVELMNLIGLGNHYQWYNGSPSCATIRLAAASKVEQAIINAYESGKEIAPPNMQILQTAMRIAEVGETDDYTLTNTWIACSYVIAEHIHQANSTDEEREDGFHKLRSFLKKTYLKNSPIGRRDTLYSNQSLELEDLLFDGGERIKCQKKL
jgi:hypothetical protein